MNESPSHYALNPSSDIVKRASKVAKAKSARKGEPKFHMTEDMRRLSTPWSVAQIRAEQIEAADLPAGVILDAAAGSGVQLIAFTTRLKRPGLAIEVDPNVGLLCAANMHISGGEEDLQRTMDRVLIGDGTDAEDAIVSYWNSLREAGTRAHPPIGMLHLDPARPKDAQRHEIDEMEPALAPLLKSWANHLETGPRGPAILLDLSPRLNEEQRSLVDAVIETSFPGIARTWEYLSQGGGRIDRLSVWIGSLSSKEPSRCVRMGKKNIMATIEGRVAKSELVSMSSPPPFGAYLTIVDPALVQSGLHEAWLDRALPKSAGHSWLRLDGRRPLLISTDPLTRDDEIDAFVIASGEIVQHRLTPPELHTIEQTAAAAARNEVGKVTLRCSLDPDLHPTLQRRLDKAMKEFEGARGFIVDLELERGSGSHTLYIVCKE
ncbi:MAG: hypothetical protein MK169_00890 [Candidatus Thalassarchaeum sp.]|nr:hypothetical protein [Candidatus Thalassarchaeum sp.]MCS5532166.1 hypothetical protein [Candidatus Poseidoniales archaeon]MEC9351667.1 hypothetical protein [Candidatus Thermoplasmatota archaeon]MEC9393504.1 hypothetical protein [Candidatus Thermoplasmatota archaeon]MED6312375.1 hypothetical protein [Candidatus Thermoplasmatota archaeon]|tara:strand:- start:8840 stop:10141 length:1302 start_codon:yes stop_codon:yes gene_type:complete